MSKGKQRPPQYNRQSKGYQQNLYKKQMKDQDVKMPKQIDVERIGKIHRVLLIVWLVLMVVIWLLLGYKAGLVCVVVGLIYVVGFMIYMNNYSNSFIKAYKQMGMPKDMYIKQLRKSGTDVKNIERMSKAWDKVKVD